MSLALDVHVGRTPGAPGALFTFVILHSRQAGVRASMASRRRAGDKQPLGSLSSVLAKE